MNNIYQAFIEDRTGEYYYLGLTDGNSNFTYGIKNESMGVNNLKRTVSRVSPEKSFIITCVERSTLDGIQEEIDFKINKMVKDKSGKYKEIPEKIELEEKFDIISVGELYKNCNVFLRDIFSNEYFIYEDSTLQRISENEYKVLIY